MLTTPASEVDRGVLGSLVRMMHQTWSWVPVGDSHVDGVDDEFGSHVAGVGPADDPSGEHIQHSGVEPQWFHWDVSFGASGTNLLRTPTVF